MELITIQILVASFPGNPERKSPQEEMRAKKVRYKGAQLSNELISPSY